MPRYLFEYYGALDHNLDAVFELNLVRYIDTEFDVPDWGVEEGGWLELTDLGRQFIDEIQSGSDEE